MASAAGLMARQIKRFTSPMVLVVIFLTISFVCSWFLVASGQFHLQSPRSITILLWHWPFGVPYRLDGDLCLRNYGIPACRLTDQRDLYDDADLVVFHHSDLRRERLPVHLSRPETQKWVWLSLEAPPNNMNTFQYDGLFNLTMSYHPLADITVPYGKLLPRAAPSADFTIPQNKIHEACWVVSNFQKRHRRTAVFQELQKNLNVTVYGSFFKKPLAVETLLPTISQCYFYLAFENTESPHYITEKLWRNAFLAGAVPVVLGPPRRDYEAVAPSNSFIHVDDFTSVEELAQFLRGLTQDPERYNSFFSWRHNYTVKLYTDWRERLCNICPVYSHFPAKKVYRDLSTWTKW